MTQAKAQTVVSAVVGAGFTADVFLRPDGVTWVVRVKAADFTIDSSTVSNFVAAQGILGKSAEVELS